MEKKEKKHVVLSKLANCNGFRYGHFFVLNAEKFDKISIKNVKQRAKKKKTRKVVKCTVYTTVSSH